MNFGTLHLKQPLQLERGCAVLIQLNQQPLSSTSEKSCCTCCLFLSMCHIKNNLYWFLCSYNARSQTITTMKERANEQVLMNSATEPINEEPKAKDMHSLVSGY